MPLSSVGQMLGAFRIGLHKVGKQSPEKTNVSVQALFESIPQHQYAVPRIISSSKSHAGRNEILKLIEHTLASG